MKTGEITAASLFTNDREQQKLDATRRGFRPFFKAVGCAGCGSVSDAVVSCRCLLPVFLYFSTVRVTNKPRR